MINIVFDNTNKVKKTLKDVRDGDVFMFDDQDDDAIYMKVSDSERVRGVVELHTGHFRTADSIFYGDIRVDEAPLELLEVTMTVRGDFGDL